MVTSHAKTPEGLELQFGTNHIGHFLFANLIIPKLLEAPAPRVVSVASVLHFASDIHFDVCLEYRSFSENLHDGPSFF